jgi:hypothetical protein
VTDTLQENSEINISNEGYTKGLTQQIVDNVKGIHSREEINFNDEFKTIQYLIDINDSVGTDAVAVWGVYLDEIEHSVLLNGVGEVVVENALDEIIVEAESNINDENICQPVVNLLSDVKDNFSNVRSKGKTWTEIFEGFQKVSDVDMAGMSDIDTALDSVGTMLDVLTGKPFKINESDEDFVSVEFVEDVSAKNFLIAIIGNNVGDVDDNAKKVIFNVYHEDESIQQELIEGFDSLLYSENSAIPTIHFTNNQVVEDNTMTGVLQNVYNLDTNDEFSWLSVCDNLKQIVNIKEVALGNHGNTPDEYRYTYYSDNKENVDGIGSKLDEIITDSESILTIEHVKYIIKNQITGVTNEKYYVKQVLNTIKANVDDLQAGTLNKECQDLQYFIDFANGGEFDNFGIYFDELNGSTLLGGIGETMLEAVVDTILDAAKDTIVDEDNNKKEFDSIREQIATIDTTINTFIGTSDQRYFFTTVQQNIGAIYANETDSTPNTTAFNAIKQIKDMIDPNLKYTHEFDISGQVEFEESVTIAMARIKQLSGWLYTLQENKLLGAIETRYIATTIIEQLVSSADISIESVVIYTYSADENNHYINNIETDVVGYKAYLQGRLSEYATIEEVYADNENGDMLLNDGIYNYIINKVFTNIIDCIKAKMQNVWDANN